MKPLRSCPHEPKHMTWEACAEHEPLAGRAKCGKLVFPGYAHLACYTCYSEPGHEGGCNHCPICPTCGSRSKTDIGVCSPCLFASMRERDILNGNR